MICKVCARSTFADTTFPKLARRAVEAAMSAQQEVDTHNHCWMGTSFPGHCNGAELTNLYKLVQAALNEDATTILVEVDGKKVDLSVSDAWSRLTDRYRGWHLPKE